MSNKNILSNWINSGFTLFRSNNDNPYMHKGTIDEINVTMAEGSFDQQKRVDMAIKLTDSLNAQSVYKDLNDPLLNLIEINKLIDEILKLQKAEIEELREFKIEALSILVAVDKLFYVHKIAPEVILSKGGSIMNNMRKLVDDNT